MWNNNTLKFSALIQTLNFKDGSPYYVSVIQTVIRSPELVRKKMDKLIKILSAWDSV
jgi:hypothetical protein